MKQIGYIFLVAAAMTAFANNTDGGEFFNSIAKHTERGVLPTIGTADSSAAATTTPTVSPVVTTVTTPTPVPVTTTAASTSTKNLVQGWNLFGATYSQDPSTIFAPSCIQSVYGYDAIKLSYTTYKSNGVIQITAPTEPRAGFWVNAVTQACALTIQTGTATAVSVSDPTGTGSVSGSILSLTDKSVLSDVVVSLSGGSAIQNSDGSGNYAISGLGSSAYNIAFSKMGYITATGKVGVVTGQNTTFSQLYMLDNSSQGTTGTLTGKIQDAVVKTQLSGATVQAIVGLNNPNGQVASTTTTDSAGSYKFSGFDAGYYTVVASKNGYVSNSNSITVVGKNQTTNLDVTLSPTLVSGQARIVLDWGNSPRDLDSHLTKVSASGQTIYHVFWDSPSSSYDRGVSLDRDNVSHGSSNGPETVTISSTDTSASYKYYVHHYDGTGTLSTSSAKVTAYIGGQTYTFNVPNQTGATHWKVFEITNGQVVPCQTNCMFNLSTGNTGTLSAQLNRSISDKSIFQNLPVKKRAY